MKNIHNAVSDMMDDLNLHPVFTEDVVDNVVTLRYKSDPNKFIRLRVIESNGEFVDVVVIEQEGSSRSFREVIVEGLIEQFDPHFWDDED